MSELTKIILSVFLIFCNLVTVFSQKDIYKFDRFTINDGLSSNSAFCVIKDNNNFIWVGTEYGLNRYDGNSIKIYTPFNAKGKLSEGWLRHLCDDGDFLWIGTTQGLNKLDKRTETFILYFHDSIDEHSIPDDQITRILKTQNNDIWIGTFNGLCKYDRSNNNFTRYIHDSVNYSHSISSNYINTLYEDSDGNLWIGTTNGLDLLLNGQERFVHYKNIPGDKNSLSSNNVSCIFEDSRREIWISTAEAINKYDRDNNIFHKIIDQRNTNSQFGNDIFNICEDSYNNIWFASSSIGITIYNPVLNSLRKIENNINDPYSLSGNYVAYMFRDNNTIWIGTMGSGISIYNRWKWKFDHYRSIAGDSASLSSPIVWSMCEDNDKNIWAATNTGLNIYDRMSGKFLHKHHNNNDPTSIVDNNIRYIYKDRHGSMWIATIGYSLEKYNPMAGGFTHYNDKDGKGFNATCFMEDSKGNYWLGLWNGIRVFDKNMNIIKTYLNKKDGIMNFDNNPIFYFYEDRESNIWVSSMTGLHMLDTQSGYLESYFHNPNDSNTLSHSFTTATVQDNEGYLWITTYGGLNKLDIKSKKFKHYTEDDGLAHNVTYGILIDNSGSLWMSTNKGISKLNPKTEVFTNYGLGDGVQGLEFATGSFYKSEEGELFFGGINGFNGFKPDKMEINNNIPKVQITSFKIFNKEADLPNSIIYTDEIHLSYWDNFFSFEFAALDYTNPQNNKYKYKLEGIDKDWVDAGFERFASYTNISPGNYTFKLIGSNNDGVWNTQGKKIKIVIIPSWWQSLWFRGLSTFIVVFIIVFIIKRKYSQLNKEHKSKEEFTRQLIGSQEQERKKISAELHDSLGQDLVIIKNSANLALDNFENKSVALKYIKQISDISDSTLSNIRTISHNLRPVELDKLGLTETIKSVVDMVSSSSGINFSSDIDIIENIFDESNDVNYCRIIQECLNNILKHSKATEASVLIRTVSEKVITKISDNGIGFNIDELRSDKSKTTFGLKGIRERVKILGGTLKINSKPGEGTEIIIEAPVSFNVKRKNK